MLGIAGAFLATFIGQAIGHYGPDQGAGFITATIGALVVLFIWNRLVASGVISDPGGEVTASRHSGARSTALSEHGAALAAMTSISRNQMQPGIHPHQFAGHVARSRRREEAHQRGDILARLRRP